VSPTSYLSAEQLTTLGRTATQASVPEQSRQSLPIPVRDVAGVAVAFFFCPSLVTPKEGGGVKMAPPHFLLLLDPTNGQIRELTPVTPASFGRNDAPDSLLGMFRLPDGMTAAQYLQQRGALFALYDQLLPRFAQQQPPSSADLRPAARKFEALFRLLREPPVEAYYEAVGHEFFQWVRDAASEPVP
jgi:hypothetical protein